MSSELPGPNALKATLVILLATMAWAWLMLGIFADNLFPLAFVLPLLLCVWTRRIWHLWFMVLNFLAIASWKMISFRHAPELERWNHTLAFTVSVLNICIGSSVIAGILVLLKRLESRNQEVMDQIAELERQAEELARQNEEIRVQSGKKAQHIEEIGAQAEELLEAVQIYSRIRRDFFCNGHASGLTPRVCPWLD